ncbi:MAG TPA: ChaN family lipoprotein [Geopsychrobacteraceae bacterium]|nr:ChaN family lipoprotein [Geopsychrobacteraceae bacterium]
MYRHIITILFLLVLNGCMGKSNLIGNPELPYLPQSEPVVGEILHMPTGQTVKKETMLEHAAQTRMVYVGEIHDNPASHHLQLEILTYLYQQNPGGVALAMEMFTPEQQEVLDRWSAGELSEKEFIKEVKWFTTWKMDYGYYRSLLTFARDNNIPVIGINAPKDLVRAVGSAPLEDQPEEIMERLPEFDFTDPYQQALTKAIYGGHPVSDSMKEGFLRIQTLWDESMAENLTDYLQSEQGDGRQVMVVAGSNHVSYGFGIPRRAFRRLPLSYLLIGSRAIEIAEGKEVETMQVTMPNFPMPPYHFLTYTRYENLPERGVKLGIQLREIEQDVTVISVIPGSAAEHAGIVADDILRKIDGIEVEESFDLIYQLEQKQMEDRAILKVERNGEIIEIDVDFSKAEIQHPPQ